MWSRQPGVTAVALTLVLCLSGPGITQAQVCSVDGVQLEFSRLRGGALGLQAVKARELTGTKPARQAHPIQTTQNLTVDVVNGVLVVDDLDPVDEVGESLANVRFDRKLANIWEANFPRDLYEFHDRSDLQVEIIATVINGEAVHLGEGTVSSVKLRVHEGRFHVQWWNKGNSLKQLRGDLEFVYSNVQQLARSGEHRATINLCVNVKGYL